MEYLDRYLKLFIATLIFLIGSNLSFAQKRMCVKLEGTESDCSGGGAGTPGLPPPPPPPPPPAYGCTDSPDCKDKAPNYCSDKSFDCNDPNGKKITCNGTKCGAECGKVCNCPVFVKADFLGFTSKQVCSGGLDFGCGAATKTPLPDNFCNCTCVKNGDSTCAATNTNGCATCDCGNAGYTYCGSGYTQVKTCNTSRTSCKRRDGTVPGTITNCACQCPEIPQDVYSLPFCDSDCVP